MSVRRPRAERRVRWGRRFAGTRFVAVERGGTERELALRRATRADLSRVVRCRAGRGSREGRGCGGRGSCEGRGYGGIARRVIGGAWCWLSWALCGRGSREVRWRACGGCERRVIGEGWLSWVGLFAGVVRVACSSVRDLRLPRLPPREERAGERRFVPSMTDNYFSVVGASLRVDARSFVGSGDFGLRGFDTVRALLYGVVHAGEFNAS